MVEVQPIWNSDMPPSTQPRWAQIVLKYREGARWFFFWGGVEGGGGVRQVQITLGCRGRICETSLHYPPKEPSEERSQVPTYIEKKLSKSNRSRTQTRPFNRGQTSTYCPPSVKRELDGLGQLDELALIPSDNILNLTQSVEFIEWQTLALIPRENIWNPYKLLLKEPFKQRREVPTQMVEK